MERLGAAGPADRTACTRCDRRDGAMLPAHNDEWTVCSRSMPLETPAPVSDAPFISLAALESCPPRKRLNAMWASYTPLWDTTPMFRDVQAMTITCKGREATVDTPGWYCDTRDESINTAEDMKVCDRAVDRLRAQVEACSNPKRCAGSGSACTSPGRMLAVSWAAGPTLPGHTRAATWLSAMR